MTMSRNFDIALIQGSIRPNRFNDTIADWATTGLDRHGVNVHRIDPRAEDLLPLQTGDDAAAAQFRARIAGMDGFVVVTPEYNHAAPGPLKSLIDAAKAEWEARPVGFVSYGGISGGLRAVESLRPVFAELHAVTLRETISFAGPWSRFDTAGRLTDPADIKATDAAMATFAASLRWWAGALSAARARMPYEKRAACATGLKSGGASPRPRPALDPGPAQDPPSIRPKPERARHVDEHIRTSFPCHHLGRKPRTGAWRHGGWLPAGRAGG